MKIALYSYRLGSSHIASDAGLEATPRADRHMTRVCPGLEEMFAVEGAVVECSMVDVTTLKNGKEASEDTDESPAG